MPADIDELLSRADRIEKRDLPTRSELALELEAALDELQQRFPNGEPEDVWDRLTYGSLTLEVSNAVFALKGPEGVNYVADLPPRLIAIEGGRDDDA